MSRVIVHFTLKGGDGSGTVIGAEGNKLVDVVKDLKMRYRDRLEYFEVI